MILKDKLFSAFFPSITVCIGCKTKVEDISLPLCNSCHKEVDYYNLETICYRCGRVYHGGKCPAPNIGKVMALAPYRGYWKEALNLFKFKNNRYLAEGFSKKAVSFLPNHIMEDIDLITFVPVTAQGLKERGFDQSYLLAKKLSKKTNIPYINSLVKNDTRSPQRFLDRRERFKNWDGVITVVNKDKIKGKKLLILDDVYTTGSTLFHCANALKGAGAIEITAFTLAN
ncbi:ComF family protein [Proteinivorax tanatarense]|uniref:ComF family protein n=1 Tax=Proteinivorax tanatarense TaxID=1260629 RepID=A0AAU7VN63_9FIRM